MSDVDDDYTEIVDVEMNEIDFELEQWTGFVEEEDALTVVVDELEDERKAVEELKDVEKVQDTEIVDVEMNENDFDFEYEQWKGFVEEEVVEKIDLNQLDVDGKAVKEFEDVEKVRYIEKIHLNQMEVERKAVEEFEDVEKVRYIEKIDLDVEGKEFEDVENVRDIEKIDHQVVHY